MTHDSTTGGAAVAEHLRAEVGRRRPGDRLPASRALVEAFGVSPVTVSRVLAGLVTEGLVVTRPGAGSFVATPRASAAPLDHSWQTVALGAGDLDATGMVHLLHPVEDTGLLSLATGYLHSSLMPVRAMAAALGRAARLPDAWDRPPPGGIHGLRTWFAQQAGPGVDAGDVIVTPGGQGAITAAFRSVASAGEPLLVESPTYPGALAVARAAGIRPVPVPTDAGGIVPELLADAFARTGARAVYCQPTFQNPTGAVLAPERRAAVLAVAAAAGAFVIEDDYARWLVHDTPAPRSLLADDPDGRVVYITSLTKVASPSLRVGALIARGPVAVRLQALRVIDDVFVARPMQEAALELVSHPGWDRHLRSLSAALTDRSRILSDAVASHLPAVIVEPRAWGGIHLWARLPDRVDEGEVTVAARRRGVVVTAGRPFFPAEPPYPALRLTYSAAPTAADLVTGAQRLAEAVPALTAPPG